MKNQSSKNNQESEPFDRYPSRYDSWFEEHPSIYRSELLAIKEFLPRFSRGLEIGVGTGRFAGPLSTQYGIDPSVPMARLAKRRGIYVVKGVGEALPFSNSIFQIILMVTTACFLKDLDRALREANRVLEGGKTLIMAIIDINSPLGKRYQRRKGDSPFYKRATFRSPGEVLSRMKRAGFRQLRTIQTLTNDEDAGKPCPGYGKGSFVVMRGTKVKET